MGRVKSRMKRFAAVVLSLAVMVPVGVFGTSQTAKADGPTGAGLAAHAMTAYNEGWAYSYGSASPGAVDLFLLWSRRNPFRYDGHVSSDRQYRYFA